MAARLLWMTLVCPPGAVAPWVRLTPGLEAAADPPVQAAGEGAGTPGAAAAAAVPLEFHGLRLPASHTRVVGNLQGRSRSLELRSARNVALVGHISVGTPPQRLSCMLDASGSDVWVPSTRCLSCGADIVEEMSKFFDERKSATFHIEKQDTVFGRAPVTARVIYGGGSVSGLLATDTVTLGPATLPAEELLLAESGGPDARNQRSWDGVCGVGWRAAGKGIATKAIYERLPNIGGLQSLYAIVPGPSRGKALLGVGAVPEGSVDPATIVWSKALEPRGQWIVSATVDGRSVAAAVETGTSFVLVPSHSYLPIVRSKIPRFDAFCGVDGKAGNLVVCDCAVRDDPILPVEVVLSGDASRKFSIPASDLFEEVEGSSGSTCVLQIQQRPETTKLDDPYGLLGAPLLDGPGLMDLGGLGSTFGMPFAPFGGDPFEDLFGSFGPPLEPFGPSMPPGFMEGIMGELNKALGESSRETNSVSVQETESLGPGGAVKEQVVETLGDGSRCETDVVRDASGKILSENTTAIGPDGKPIPTSSLVCAGTHVQRRRLQQERALASDVWVIGEIFLRRYAVVLDFAAGRLGVAEPLAALAGSAVVPVEALQEAFEATPQRDAAAALAHAAALPGLLGLSASASAATAVSALLLFGLAAAVALGRRATRALSQQHDTIDREPWPPAFVEEEGTPLEEEAEKGPVLE